MTRKRLLTVQDALPVIVGLDLGQIGADELIIEFVLDVGEQNEGGDDTLTAAALDLALDLAVPDVVVVGEQGAAALGWHGHDKIAVLGLGFAAVHPVVLGRIAQVLVIAGGIVEVVPGVLLAHADGLGSAGIE